MENRDAFSSYHPAVTFLFFGIVFLFSCVCAHPVCQLISLFAAMYYYIHLKGKKAVGFLFKGMLPLLVFPAIINPLFSHAGVTVLRYLPSGNPLTAESIFYGVQAGIMLAGVLLWFACFSQTVTVDKFVYLFGRIVPAFSLLLSMTLRFIPRFRRQFDTVKEVQSALGLDTTGGHIFRRIKNAVACFSAVVTWSLENAIDVSDSMKSRGYGTGRRTAYSIYTFTERDKTALWLLLLGGAVLFFNLLSGNLFWRWYPSVSGLLIEPITIFTQLVFLLLCSMPIIIDKREEIFWKRLKSKI